MNNRSFSVAGNNVEYLKCDTVIVGSGAAGFAAANRLIDADYKDILMVTEGVNMGTSRNTGSDKQTYYKLNLCGDICDSPREMARTLFSGESMDGDLALCEAANSARCFYYLCEAGVPFPFNEAGEYAGYKTDHDPAMRATSAGPLTSKFMTECLQKKALERGLEILDKYQVTDLVVTDNKCCGIVAINRADGRWICVHSKNVIFASGGPCGIYSAVVFPASQTGSSGILLKAGATAKNLMEWQYGITSKKFRWNNSGSYQQVIPRYVSTDQNGEDEKEFLREYFETDEQMLNAQFLKGYQWPFDPRKTKIENGGSSIIDVAVYKEITEKKRRVWLDYMHNPEAMQNSDNCFKKLGETAYEYLSNSGCLLPTPIERLEHMNPNAYDLYMSHGIDLSKEMLEVEVSAQHNNGGIEGDIWWESSIPHLFPIGEVNGSHGVYRPGGCALNSGQVGALRSSQKIVSQRNADEFSDEESFVSAVSDIIEKNSAIISRLSSGNGRKPDEIILDLKSSMSANCAHMRSKDKINSEIQILDNLEEEFMQSAKAESLAEVLQAFKLSDFLTTSKALAKSIQFYIENGGGSRGSYLIEGTENDNGKMKDNILEVRYKENKIECSFRKVRPIPEVETWFENVWRNYNNKYNNR